MKNLSLEKICLWSAIISLWTFLFLLSNGAFAQTNWTNIGNGLQTRVVSGFREYRFTAITGYQPFNVTDSLKKKITTPDPLIPGIVIGTTLSTNVIGLVGYSQTPMGDQLAMYNFGGQLSTANPVDPTDAVNKQYLLDSLAQKQPLENQRLSTLNNVAFNSISLPDENTGGGIYLGDDLKLSDADLSNSTLVSGLQDSTKGFFRMGASSESIGFDGVDYVIGLNRIFTEGNLNPSLYQLRSEKGANNGYASLGADGKVPNSQIPALAISETFVVNSEAAMLGLSAAEQGDVAVRTDISQSFILTQAPASTLSNWQVLLTPTDAVSSVNGQVGNVNLTTTDIPEGSNLYYTEARVNANTNVAANTANRHAPVTIGTANGLSLSTQQLSLGLASGSTTGALSSTDYNTFNNKQPAGSYALTNGSNATGTWPIGIAGNAATATQWGNSSGTYNGTNFASPAAIMSTDGNNWGYTGKGQMQSWLEITSGGETLQSVTDNGNTASNTMFINGSNRPAGNPTGKTLGFEYVIGDDIANIFAYDYFNSIYKNVGLAVGGGNVGIGTSAPSVKLDVNGAGNFSGNVTAPSAQFANAPVNPTDVVRKTELDLKAPLASPVFTGTPTAPTPSAATNNDRLATTQFVTTALINRRKNTVSITSGSTTGIIQGASIYTFSSTASGCTLPSIASSAGWEVVFINRASGSITVNSNAGGNDIDQSGVLSSTMVLATGDSMTMVNNGFSWVVIK